MTISLIHMYMYMHVQYHVPRPLPLGEAADIHYAL